MAGEIEEGPKLIGAAKVLEILQESASWFDAQCEIASVAELSEIAVVNSSFGSRAAYSRRVLFRWPMTRHRSPFAPAASPTEAGTSPVKTPTNHGCTLKGDWRNQSKTAARRRATLRQDMAEARTSRFPCASATFVGADDILSQCSTDCHA
jgi:hypothetical protein